MFLKALRFAAPAGASTLLALVSTASGLAACGAGSAGAGSKAEVPRQGRLPPDVIQKIVRLHYGSFRKCYEDGLAKKETLTGRVTTRFSIDEDGAVRQVQNGGSDMPDQEVVRCVISEFRQLVFPRPEGGKVTVVYPIMFAPGE
jgi:hypothetical protein